GLMAETITLAAALLGAKFTIARIVFPVVVTVLMGLALNALQARRIRKFQPPPRNPTVSDLKAGCCADDEPLEGKRMFWRSFTALLHPLWIYFVLGLIAVAILQTFVPPRDIARYLHGGIGAYLLAAVAGIPLYVCRGGEGHTN